MRAILQRVSSCSLEVNDEPYSEIAAGLLLLVGYEEDDSVEDVDWLLHKVINMRIFSDSDGKMNLSLLDVKGSLMIVSQFTLYASYKKGNRPSYLRSAKPEISKPLYEETISIADKLMGKPTAKGIFGADMDITLTNDGPVTIHLDTKNKE